jgi:hypothetical protein
VDYGKRWPMYQVLEKVSQELGEEVSCPVPVLYSK